MTSPRYLTDQFGMFLTEAPTKVLVGEDREAYYIHPSVLSSSKSSSVDVRMSGAWKHTGDGTVDWTDFDKQTIECVIHYLYSGDYYVPESVEEAPNPGREGEEVCLEQPEGEPLPTDETSPTYHAQSPDESTLVRPLTPTSRCLGVGLPEERLRTAAGVIAETEFKDHDLSVGMSILVHAKVYSFAHVHFFSDLATFALQRLTQVLILAPRKRNSLFPYLADAIRHIYSTTTLGRETGEDPARTLLSQYVALNYTDLAGDELDALADDGGDFMVDVSNKLARRIATSGHCIGSRENQVDELTTQVRELRTRCRDQEIEIRRASKEIQEWMDWNRGVSKNARRRPVVEPVDDPDDWPIGR